MTDVLEEYYRQDAAAGGGDGRDFLVDYTLRSSTDMPVPLQPFSLRSKLRPFQ